MIEEETRGDNKASSIAKSLMPSARGETEIVDMLNYYLKHDTLKVELLGRGVSWLDTGTHKSLHEASTYIEVLENRQGLKIACLEEIAFQRGYISKDELIALAEKMSKSDYGQYLMNVAHEN